MPDNVFVSNEEDESRMTRFTEGIARLENIMKVVSCGDGVIRNGKHLRSWPQIFGNP
jgi:hypothetical protein